MKPEKILELGANDWGKGISIQPTLMRGGVFSAAPGFDPFEKEGYLLPSLSATEITAPATSPIKVFTHWTDGGTEKIYAHSESKLYEYLRNSPYTQTDKTAEIDITGPLGNTNCAGAIIFKGKYVYSQDTDVRANSLPVAVANDVQILNGSNTYSDLDYRKLEIGPDKNLYVADGDNIGKITNVAGTSSNTLAAFTLETGYCARDILNDGRYLVIGMDNNTRGGTTGKTTNRQVGNYSCKIYFWDAPSAKTTPDIVYDIHGDSYIVGMKQVGDLIYVFTYNGIYVCTSSMPPKMIWSFTGNSSITKRPTNPYAITSSEDTVYWGDCGTNGQNIYAVKRSGNSFVFYTPYITHGSTHSHQAIKFGGEGTIWASTSYPKAYIHNVGTTRGNATAVTAVSHLSQPFRFSYAVITLLSPMSSGQAVGFYAKDSNDSIVVDTFTRSYSTHGALKKIVVHPTTSATAVREFEDLYIGVNPQGGAAVSRVAVYGFPIDDATQLPA